MNRRCLKSFLKMSRDGTLWISVGREFQRMGAGTLKALTPKVCSLVLGWGADLCLRTTTSREECRGCERLVRCWGMEGFVGREEEFIIDAGLDWEPVKVNEVEADMLPGLSADKNSGRRF